MTTESFMPPDDPASLRKQQPYNEALPLTIRWVARLPAEMRPMALLRQFPRVANVLARGWRSPPECQRNFEDLLVDRRQGRRGFPPEVAEELRALRDYYHGRYPHLPSWTQNAAD